MSELQKLKAELVDVKGELVALKDEIEALVSLAVDVIVEHTSNWVAYVIPSALTWRLLPFSMMQAIVNVFLATT